MRKFYLAIWLIFIATSASANLTTSEEAARVAESWLKLIVEGRGSWGKVIDPRVIGVVPLEKGGRLVGHLAEIDPEGWVVVPLHRELAPVKAYSESGRLDPSASVGLPDLVKLSLDRSLDTLESLIAKSTSSAGIGLVDLVEVDHTRDWDRLLEGAMSYRTREKTAQQNDGIVPGGNYEMGEALLTSAWRQGWPYNNELPEGGVYIPGQGWVVQCDHVLVGCVAVVGAQIMRYWNWPEAGSGSGYDDPYDWANMPDTIDASSPAYQINAVAELSAEVGLASDLTYGCDSTGGFLYAWHDRDLEDALTQNFGYDEDSPNRLDRVDSDAVTWFETVKAHADSNIPVPYGVPGHAIVVDGWQEVGTTPIRQYHVNYGWGNGVPQDPDWEGYSSSITWITLDELPGSSLDDEHIVVNIKPDLALTWAGLITMTENQFDDAYVGMDLHLHPFGWLSQIEFVGETQFLPGMTVTCQYEPGFPEEPVRFKGSPARPGSVLSRRGTGHNIRLHDGEIVLHHSGRLKIH